MGGIDRLNDSIIDGISSRPELEVRCKRLVTRGKGGLAAAQFVFAAALLKFSVASLLGQIDLLHIHLSIRGSSYRKAVLARAARLFRVPYVVHLHGTDYREFWTGSNTALRHAIDLTFLHAEKILVLGNFWAEVVCDRLPSVRSKIVVLPNATAAAKAKASLSRSELDPVRITFLGQLGRRKGTADLLCALANLADFDNWSATLAGDGAVEEAKEQSRQLGLQSQVHIPGWLGVEERTKLLNATDILVLPSYAENLPMVVLEAFAQGIPVISTPVGAIPEVVKPEHNGLLVSPGDISALTDAIKRLIANPDLRLRMGNAAHQDHATRFELQSYLGRLAKLWHAARLPESTDSSIAYPSSQKIIQLNSGNSDVKKCG